MKSWERTKGKKVETDDGWKQDNRGDSTNIRITSNSSGTLAVDVIFGVFLAMVIALIAIKVIKLNNSDKDDNNSSICCCCCCSNDDSKSYVHSKTKNILLIFSKCQFFILFIFPFLLLPFFIFLHLFPRLFLFLIFFFVFIFNHFFSIFFHSWFYTIHFFCHTFPHCFHEFP